MILLTINKVTYNSQNVTCGFLRSGQDQNSAYKITPKHEKYQKDRGRSIITLQRYQCRAWEDITIEESDKKKNRENRTKIRL